MARLILLAGLLAAGIHVLTGGGADDGVAGDGARIAYTAVHADHEQD
jgi:hypothetical protein